MQDHPSSSSSIFQTLDLESLDGVGGGLRRWERHGPHTRPYRGRQRYGATHATGSSFASDLSSVASVVSTVLPVVLGLL